MSKSRQSRLPGLEADPADGPKRAARAEVKRPPPPAGSCDPAAELAADSEERPAEPVESLGTSLPVRELAGKTVYIVDAHSLIFQVFHALPEMTGPRGQPTGAIFGFTRDMMYLLEQKKPDYLFAAFDLSGPTFRHGIAATYKEHRTEMPDSLSAQLPDIRRMLAALGIPVLECEGFEADDILATVARITEQSGGQCFLVSGDKDFRQLLTDRVKIFNVRKQEAFDAAALKEEWGIRPDQVVDFQALVGDSVDNIPGVPLVGPKVAGEWLTRYETLDNLLAHVDELPKGKRKDNLLASREQLPISRRLARLDDNVSMSIDWARGRAGRYDPAGAAELFSEFGFQSLTNQMRERAKTAQPAMAQRYETIATADRLRWLVAQLKAQKTISLDTETTSIYPRWAQIVGYSFAWKEGEAYYVPVRAPAGEPCLDAGAVAEALRPVLENPAIEKVGQNLKYDMIVLRNAGIELGGVQFDTMLAAYLLDAGQRNYNLDELAAKYLNHTTTKIAALIGSGKNQKRMDEVPVAQVSHYAAEDADIALRLVPVLAGQMQESKLERLFHDVEMPVVHVLADLENTGVTVDVARLGELSRKYSQRLAELEKEIFAIAGHEFNIASPKQLQEVLFVEHKLPVLKKTKTGPSTDVEVLEELARDHPLPAKIIQFRQYAKLKGTYVDAIPGLIHPQTGRVHASFNQVVAATGRLSASDPNLQNIPIRTDEGREIRSAFLPGRPDWSLLAADYSQIELRVLAHFSGDATLRAAFDRDEDIHARVASQVYGVPLESVTPAMRRVAKAVNFGVIYGQSPFGLAKTLDIEQDEAARYIDAYFNGYRGVEQFLRDVLVACRKQGYVTTILGRRRAIQGVRDITLTRLGDPAARQRTLPERTAINTVIQGSAADLMKLAMINVHQRMRREKLRSRMLLQIHDELIFEVPPEEMAGMQKLVRDEMAGVMRLEVPLKVDVKTGPNWAACEAAP